MAHMIVLDGHAVAAVTFDLFGTLVELDESRLPVMRLATGLEPSLLAAPLRRLAELAPGVDPAEALVAYCEANAELRRTMNATHQEFSDRLRCRRWLERLGVADEFMVGALVQSQNAATIHAARLVEGVGALLGQLRRLGVTIGMVSNVGDAQMARELLSRLDLRRYLAVTALSADIGWRKPHRRLYEKALAGLRASPGEVVHIGDELTADILGAGEAGLKTVWINPNRQPFRGDYPPLLQVGRLSEITAAF